VLPLFGPYLRDDRAFALSPRLGNRLFPDQNSTSYPFVLMRSMFGSLRGSGPPEHSFAPSIGGSLVPGCKISVGF